MTLLLLLGLIYAVFGGVTALEVRSLGIPSVTHLCSAYECPVATRETWRCPGAWAGRGPLTVFGWLGAVLAWPLVWAYCLLVAILVAVLYVGTRRV